jgi:hypothetical protein
MDVSSERKGDVEQLRNEVERLGRVITEVVGEEFDAIMSRQAENQQSLLRWFVQSFSTSVVLMQILVERGLIDEEECRERIRAMHARLITHSDNLGSDPEVRSMFGDGTAASAEDDPGSEPGSGGDLEPDPPAGG